MNMRFVVSAISVSALALAAGAALAQSSGYSNYDWSQPPVVVSQPVPPDRGTNDDTSGGRTFADQPFDVNGTQVVCTGIDSDSRHDSRWPSYPLKLEFAGAGGQFLGEERVQVSGNGVNVNVRCKGPWVLMRVPAGSYSVQATVRSGATKSGTVNVSGHGQARLVMTFPAGGATTGQNNNDE